MSVPRLVIPIDWLDYVMGLSWPAGDEDGMRQISDAWKTCAVAVMQAGGDGSDVTAAVNGAVNSASADEFTAYWNKHVTSGGILDQLGQQCAQTANYAEQAATLIESTKISMNVVAVLMYIEFIEAMIEIAATFGFGTPAVAAQLAAEEFCTREALIMLAKSLLKAMEFTVLPDLVSQTWEAVTHGDTSYFDTDKLLHDFEHGLVLGALFAIPGLGSRSGLTGKLASKIGMGADGPLARNPLLNNIVTKTAGNLAFGGASNVAANAATYYLDQGIQAMGAKNWAQGETGPFAGWQQAFANGVFMSGFHRVADGIKTQYGDPKLRVATTDGQNLLLRNRGGGDVSTENPTSGLYVFDHSDPAKKPEYLGTGTVDPNTGAVTVTRDGTQTTFQARTAYSLDRGHTDSTIAYQPSDNGSGYQAAALTQHGGGRDSTLPPNQSEQYNAQGDLTASAIRGTGDPAAGPVHAANGVTVDAGTAHVFDGNGNGTHVSVAGGGGVTPEGFNRPLGPNEAAVYRYDGGLDHVVSYPGGDHGGAPSDRVPGPGQQAVYNADGTFRGLETQNDLLRPPAITDPASIAAAHARAADGVASAGAPAAADVHRAPAPGPAESAPAAVVPAGPVLLDTRPANGVAIDGATPRSSQLSLFESKLGGRQPGDNASEPGGRQPGDNASELNGRQPADTADTADTVLDEQNRQQVLVAAADAAVVTAADPIRDTPTTGGGEDGSRGAGGDRAGDPRNPGPVDEAAPGARQEDPYRRSSSDVKVWPPDDRLPEPEPERPQGPQPAPDRPETPGLPETPASDNVRRLAEQLNGSSSSRPRESVLPRDEGAAENRSEPAPTPTDPSREPQAQAQAQAQAHEQPRADAAHRAPDELTGPSAPAPEPTPVDRALAEAATVNPDVHQWREQIRRAGAEAPEFERLAQDPTSLFRPDDLVRALQRDLAPVLEAENRRAGDIVRLFQDSGLPTETADKLVTVLAHDHFRGGQSPAERMFREAVADLWSRADGPPEPDGWRTHGFRGVIGEETVHPERADWAQQHLAEFQRLVDRHLLLLPRVPLEEVRPYHLAEGGLNDVEPEYQRAVENAVPRGDWGNPVVHPEVTHDWVDTVNDGGPSADYGRGVNCADCTRAGLETWFGNPQASAARLHETDAAGRPQVTPEADSTENLERWAGAKYTWDGPGNQGLAAVEAKVAEAGPGSAAVVAVSWPHVVDPVTGQQTGGGGHSITCVNDGGVVKWVDFQMRQITEVGPGRTYPIPVEHVWSIVLGADRNPIVEFGRNGGQDANTAHGTAGRPAPDEAAGGFLRRVFGGDSGEPAREAQLPEHVLDPATREAVEALRAIDPGVHERFIEQAHEALALNPDDPRVAEIAASHLVRARAIDNQLHYGFSEQAYSGRHSDHLVDQRVRVLRQDRGPAYSELFHRVEQIMSGHHEGDPRRALADAVNEAYDAHLDHVIAERAGAASSDLAAAVERMRTDDPLAYRNLRFEIDRDLGRFTGERPSPMSRTHDSPYSDRQVRRFLEDHVAESDAWKRESLGGTEMGDPAERRRAIDGLLDRWSGSREAFRRGELTVDLDYLAEHDPEGLAWAVQHFERFPRYFDAHPAERGRLIAEHVAAIRESRVRQHELLGESDPERQALLDSVPGLREAAAVEPDAVDWYRELKAVATPRSLDYFGRAERSEPGPDRPARLLDALRQDLAHARHERARAADGIIDSFVLKTTSSRHSSNRYYDEYDDDYDYAYERLSKPEEPPYGDLTVLRPDGTESVEWVAFRKDVAQRLVVDQPAPRLVADRSGDYDDRYDDYDGFGGSPRYTSESVAAYEAWRAAAGEEVSRLATEHLELHDERVLNDVIGRLGDAELRSRVERMRNQDDPGYRRLAAEVAKRAAADPKAFGSERGVRRELEPGLAESEAWHAQQRRPDYAPRGDMSDIETALGGKDLPPEASRGLSRLAQEDPSRLATVAAQVTRAPEYYAERPQRITRLVDQHLAAIDENARFVEREKSFADAVRVADEASGGDGETGGLGLDLLHIERQSPATLRELVQEAYDPQTHRDPAALTDLVQEYRQRADARSGLRDALGTADPGGDRQQNTEARPHDGRTSAPPPPDSQGSASQDHAGPADDQVAAARRAAGSTRTDSGGVSPEAVRELLDSVPRVPDVSEDSVRALVATVHAGEVRLEPVGGNGGRARTERPVYRVIADGETIGYVKVLPDTEDFARELSATDRLLTADLTEFIVPDILAVASMEGPEGERAGVLVFTAARGDSVEDLMRRVPLAWDRDAALSELRSAVVEVARGMAELHGRDAGGREASRDFLARHVEAIRGHLERLEERRQALERLGIDLGPIRAELERTIEAALADPGPAGLAHGDAHLGNFLWDETDGATVIDAPTLHGSMDAAGDPIGSPARDVALFDQRIEHFGSEFGLSHEQIADLREAFARAYAERGGPETPAHVRALFEARAAMHRLARAVDRAVDRPDPRTRPAVGAAAAAVQHALGIDHTAATDLANGFAGELPGTPEFRRDWIAIDNVRSYMLHVADPEVRERFLTEFGDRIDAEQSRQTGDFKKLWGELFPSKSKEAELRSEQRDRAESVVRELTARSDRLAEEVVAFAAEHGVTPAMIDREGTAAWEASFRAIQSRIEEVIADPGFTYKGNPLGYIGSMKTGWRGPHKGKTRFDPNDFDVDMYVVVDAETFQDLATRYPDLVSGDMMKIMPEGGYPPDLVELGIRVGQALKAAFPDVRGIEDSVIAVRADQPW